jgi:hypothetical protein
LDGFAVVAMGGATLGFFDQQWQVRLDAPGGVLVKGCMEVLHGWIGLIGQQEATGKMHGCLGIVDPCIGKMACMLHWHWVYGLELQKIGNTHN